MRNELQNMANAWCAFRGFVRQCVSLELVPTQDPRNPRDCTFAIQLNPVMSWDQDMPATAKQMLLRHLQGVRASFWGLPSPECEYAQTMLALKPQPPAGRGRLDCGVRAARPAHCPRGRHPSPDGRAYDVAVGLSHGLSAPVHESLLRHIDKWLADHDVRRPPISAPEPKVAERPVGVAIVDDDLRSWLVGNLRRTAPRRGSRSHRSDGQARTVMAPREPP